MSPVKIEANRQNATLSTGPTSPQGKAISSRNAISHGLTSAHCLLPTEDPADFAAHLQSYRDTFQPQHPQSLEMVDELADLRWRLQRVPVFEAQILSVEAHRLQHDEQLRPLTDGLSQPQILALAFTRLVERKVLQNLHNQEARLNRRADILFNALVSVRAETPPPTSAKALPKTVERFISQNEPTLVTPQLGRNETCSCGSGIKFKRCCLNRPSSAPIIAKAA